QGFANPERLLTGAWLGDEQIIKINTKFFRVRGIESVLDVNERRQPATLLRLCNHRQGKCRFPRRFWAENFYYAASWKSAHTESAIDQNVSSGNDIDIDNFLVAKAHDRAFTVVFCYLLNRQIQVLISCRSQFVCGCLFFGLCRHIRSTLSTTQATIRQAQKQAPWIGRREKGRERSVRGL